ncbi:MAG: hypothetical protein JW863_10620 [Chitinispirillaceae bacterium]|nr:hypothetical protein [Chitinispirillaceae bacterium]
MKKKTGGTLRRQSGTGRVVSGKHIGNGGVIPAGWNVIRLPDFSSKTIGYYS